MLIDSSGRKAVENSSTLSQNGLGFVIPPDTIDIGKFLNDRAFDGVVYKLVEYRQNAVFLNEQDAQIMSKQLKTAQFLYDLPMKLIDFALDALIGSVVKAPKAVKFLKGVSDKVNSYSEKIHYLFDNWSPSGTYYITAAVYWCAEQGNYILYTNINSDVVSTLCHEGIRGVDPELINWEQELSLQVIVSGP